MLSYENLPLITIITVVYNSELYIEETIQSVLNQEYKNIEYIIIDGGSTDSTVDIIKKYSDKITYWISERDNGLYDAMNKGIKVAKGEWFNFLNSGDRFVNNSVIQKIFACSLGQSNLVFGDIMVLKESGQNYHHKAGNLLNDKSLMKGMTVCHQAIFYHRGILELYDSSLRIKAEWKHLIHITRKIDFKPLYFNFPFVFYRLGGLSATLNNVNQLEYKKVFMEEYGIYNYIMHIPYFIYMAGRKSCKKILLKLNLIR